MVVEHALLQVKAGQREQFEKVIHKAKPLIAMQSGFQSIEVRPSVETPNLFLLLVTWDSVESHRDGFRKSPEYSRMARLAS